MALNAVDEFLVVIADAHCVYLFSLADEMAWIGSLTPVTAGVNCKLRSASYVPTIEIVKTSQ